MLISMPAMEEIYKRCCGVSEDRDPDRDYVHPTRLINFLVGLRGKNETMAIGGPWSPSLDGPNPEKDPSVLIRTAVRTCKALTGIDLSSCTQWYVFSNRNLFVECTSLEHFHKQLFFKAPICYKEQCDITEFFCPLILHYLYFRRYYKPKVTIAEFFIF